MEPSNGSGNLSREFTFRFLRVLIVLLIAAVTAVLFTAGVAFLWPRSHCADSDTFRGLATMTVGFLVSVIALARLPIQRNRAPHDPVIPAILLLIVCWYPWCMHWPPLSRGYAHGAIRDMRSIADQMDGARIANGSFPKVDSVGELNKLLHASLRENDPWGTEYSFHSDGQHYTLVSFGNCGEPDVTTPSLDSEGHTTPASADIVLRDGVFTQVPSGMWPLK